MMLGITSKGAAELATFEVRLRRSFAMGRITEDVFKELLSKTQELRNLVASSNEVDPNNKREF